MAAIGVFIETITGLQGKIKTALLHIGNITIGQTTGLYNNSPDFNPDSSFAVTVCPFA